MQMAYLGLFERVFNWVLDKIFQPVFRWLSDLLNTVFTWIFNEILAPILLPVLETAFEFLVELWLDIYGVVVYTLFAGVLKLIDYMETAFDVFIGIRDVTYDPNPAIRGDEITGSLVEVLLQQGTVSRVFWLLTAAGLAIALMLTIFATAKSSFDLDFEGKRPVSKVLAAMMKTFIQFFMVPFMVYFLLKLSATILQVTSSVFNGGISTTLGRIVFLVASLNAAKPGSGRVNAVDKPSYSLGVDSRDVARHRFYAINPVNVSAEDYADLDAVQNYFDISEFDYLIGFLAAVFLFFTIAVCLITFVQRIFEIMLLYIVSPYFVSTMPLDDGERFGRWRDLFVGKCFTGFGSAIGMRLYMLVCPLIMGNQIQFSANSSVEMDYIMKLFFLAGGAWAVFKSGPMITSLLNFSAGQQESMTQAAAGGALYAYTAGKMISAGKGAIASAFRGKSGEKASAQDKAGKNKDQEQKFNGTNRDKWTKGIIPDKERNGKITIGTRKPVAGASGGSNKPTDGTAKKTAFAVKPGGPRKGPVTIGANRGKPSVQTAGGAQTAGGEQLETRARSNAMSEDREHQAAAFRANALAKAEALEATKREHNGKGFKLGSLFQNTYDDKGNHKIRVLGVGVNRDAYGKTTAVRLPGLKVKKSLSGEKMQVTKFHVPGVVNVQSNVRNGRLYYSDVSILGAMKYHSGSKGKSYSLGSHLSVEKGTDGTVSHVKVAGVHVHNTSKGVGVDIGKIHYSNEMTGSKFSIGEGLSIETNRSQGKLENLNIGSLQYSRSGKITKRGGETADNTKTGGK